MEISKKECKQHITELNTEVTNYMTKLFEIWKTVGFNHEIIINRLSTVKTLTKELFEGMINEEEKNKNIIFGKIEEHLNTLITLEKELDDITPSSTYETLTPNEKVFVLSKRIEDLNKKRDILINEYEKLENLNNKYALLLGLDSFPKYEGLIPSETYLKQLSNRIDIRKGEYNNLCDHFESLSNEASLLIKELEIESSESYQECLQSSIDFNNVIKLGKIVNELKEKKQCAEKKSTILKEEINCLWVRLKETTVNKEYFLKLGFGKKSINELNAELDRLKLIKNERLQEFLKEIRQELESWWDRCFYGPKQKAEFTPMNSNLYTTELLELHEMEIQRVREYYENNLAIFDMIAQRDVLWNRMKELELNAQDPKRFGNRGGQLLKEEKDRVKIQKQLPKLESHLEKLLIEYKQSTDGKDFIIFDEPLLSIIEKQWNEYYSSKEQERHNRKIAKGSETKVASKRVAVGSAHSETKRLKMAPANNVTRTVTRKLFDKTLASVDSYEGFQALSTQKQANSTMILNTGSVQRVKSQQNKKENLPVTPVKPQRTPRKATPGRSPRLGNNTNTPVTRLTTARRGKLPIII